MRDDRLSGGQTDGRTDGRSDRQGADGPAAKLAGCGGDQCLNVASDSRVLVPAGDFEVDQSASVLPEVSKTSEHQ